TLDDPMKPPNPVVALAFATSIFTLLIHALLLLGISLRLGAYRASHYQHTHATVIYSNPASKIRIHTPALLITFGIVGFCGGIVTAILTGDGTLGGFWPAIPGGVICLFFGWFSAFMI
ncbi:hypothetical protein HDU76_009713, partial [Blyttiomyces sp. JEL0837]